VQAGRQRHPDAVTDSDQRTAFVVRAPELAAGRGQAEAAAPGPACALQVPDPAVPTRHLDAPVVEHELSWRGADPVLIEHGPAACVELGHPAGLVEADEDEVETGQKGTGAATHDRLPAHLQLGQRDGVDDAGLVVGDVCGAAVGGDRHGHRVRAQSELAAEGAVAYADQDKAGRRRTRGRLPAAADEHGDHDGNRQCSARRTGSVASSKA
jgi:hypothetical protein